MPRPRRRPPMSAPRYASRLARVAVLAAACCGASCSGEAARGEPSARASSTPERLRQLREREAALRNALSPRQQPPWLDVSGSDPYRIVARAPRGGYFGILRGSRALVALDAELNELSRAPLAESPTSLCASSADTALVASRYRSELVRVQLGAAGPVVHVQPLPGELGGVADLACGAGGSSYVLAAGAPVLLTLDAGGRVLDRRPAMAGGLRLARRGRYLLESSLFERSLRVLQLDARGVPRRELGRVRHDGPLWAFDAQERDGALLLAVAGAEDRPLSRAHGEFENIDSFVWLYRLGARLERLAELNVGEHGVVVPKAVLLGGASDRVGLTVLGGGSGRLLHASWTADLREPPRLLVQPAPPGASDAALQEDAGASSDEAPNRAAPGVVYASPLFDAWIQVDRAGARLSRVDPERRPEPALRLGEALFFTELIAPDNRSAGGHSRFSCETCHFEGGVDGRVHYTGRGDVSVVTKPLFGLANNRPHFSRALDPDLSAVCHNEFRVAGAGSGRDPWFSLDVSRFPWLHELGVQTGRLSPLELRVALLRFLYEFSHAPNARAQGRRHFSAPEADGARVFRERCADCHAPRLLSDDAGSAAAFEAWEELIFSRNAPLVWARADYAKTGVLPYVHERGARVTSLRRLALKPRYFTNGSAPDLASVLERFRYGPEGSLHEPAEGSRLSALSLPEREALLAFLRLL